MYQSLCCKVVQNIVDVFGIWFLGVFSHRGLFLAPIEAVAFGLAVVIFRLAFFIYGAKIFGSGEEELCSGSE